MGERILFHSPSHFPLSVRETKCCRGWVLFPLLPPHNFFYINFIQFFSVWNFFQIFFFGTEMRDAFDCVRAGGFSCCLTGQKKKKRRERETSLACCEKLRKIYISFFWLWLRLMVWGRLTFIFFSGKIHFSPARFRVFIENFFFLLLTLSLSSSTTNFFFALLSILKIVLTVAPRKITKKKKEVTQEK